MSDKSKITGQNKGFGFRFHLLIYLAVNGLLFVINFMFSPSYWWFLYPLLGWLIILMLHVSILSSVNWLPPNRSVLLHFTIYFFTNALLLFIDLYNSGRFSWVIFPLVFWGAGLLLHAIVIFEYVSKNKNKLKIQREERRNKKITAPTASKLEKFKAMSKKARLMASQTMQQGKNVDEHPIRSTETPLIGPKPKKLEINKVDSIKELSNTDKKELEKTESEVNLEENEAICIVHKGAIVGTVYICPKCKTYYCLKCANTLKEKGEPCWTCEREITP